MTTPESNLAGPAGSGPCNAGTDPPGVHPAADSAEGARRSSWPDETAALREAARGNGRAFAAVYERYAGMVHAVIVASGRARDAEDLTQETCLKALRKAWQVREG